LKTKYKGPALPCAADKEDIIDEALNFFKANVFFRNFEVKGPADRVLIYLTLYISSCLSKIAPTDNKSNSEKNMYQLAIENFALPGDKVCFYFYYLFFAFFFILFLLFLLELCSWWYCYKSSQPWRIRFVIIHIFVFEMKKNVIFQN
jgi:hypothetical protein